jgi:hypothetical protein
MVEHAKRAAGARRGVRGAGRGVRVGLMRVYPTVSANAGHGASTDAPADTRPRWLGTLCFVNIMIDDHNLRLQTSTMDLSFVNRSRN